MENPFFEIVAQGLRSSSRASIAALFAGIAALCAPSAHADPNFRHGVSLFHPFASADKSGAADRHFLSPPFGRPSHALTPQQIQAIRSSGFDFVRLPVDTGPFLDAKGSERGLLYQSLDQTVRTLLAADVDVIVDFHPNPFGPAAYDPKVLVSSPDAPVLRDYCAMVSRTALLLTALRTDHVALELMNEPPLGYSQAENLRWEAILKKLYQCARRPAPRLTLVLAGDQGGNPPGLVALDPDFYVRDPKTLFTFHYYEPHEFTYQSSPSSPHYRIAVDIAYPASARSYDDSVSALTARVNKVDSAPTQKTSDMSMGMADLAKYKAQDFSKASIRTDFGKIADWAQSHGIAASRIYMGEFGVVRRVGPYNGAREAERLSWLHDVEQAADSHGFSWSLWAFSGSGGMEITNDEAYTVVDQPTLCAVGLNSTAKC